MVQCQVVIGSMKNNEEEEIEGQGTLGRIISREGFSKQVTYVRNEAGSLAAIERVSGVGKLKYKRPRK